MPSAEKLYFATTNKNKFAEAKDILSEFDIEIRILREKKIEIQSPNIEEIARKSASWITENQNKKIIVEDAGFFVESLKGFPGPYSSYVFEKIGMEGILKLLEGKDNRNAEFRSAVAFCKPGEDIKIFTNKIIGTVAFERKGTKGFGFDPIFIPSNLTRTFAEMSIEEKSNYSHRAGALKKFANWYLRQEK
jgi:XTP/dITP diphosphohydrolase